MNYVDLTDLFVYARNYSTPTGIQRVCLKIIATDHFRTLHRSGRVQAIVHFYDHRAAFRVDPDCLEERFARIRDVFQHRRRTRMVKAFVTSIPKRLRKYLVPRERREWAFLRSLVIDRNPIVFGPDDRLLILGAGWLTSAFHQSVAQTSAELAFVNYDLLPLSDPDLSPADFDPVNNHRAWFEEVAKACSWVLSISDYSARAYRTHFPDRANRQRFKTIRLGSESQSAISGGKRALAQRPYVLNVSTIEVRKNHLRLFQAWQRLAKEMAEVPLLIIVGRRGWMADAFFEEMERTNGLNGLIQVREGADDAELMTLYDGALFTVFPSLAEGWGLPVAESLAKGVPCLASKRTSIPEVGGDLVEYFDPENLDDMVAKLRAWLTAPDQLARMEERIRREYRPPSWEDTARDVFSIME